MKALKLAIFCVVLGGVVAALILGAQSNERLRREVAALRPARGVSDALRQENQRLAAAAAGRDEIARAEHDELVRLRAQLSAWRGQLDDLATRPAPAAPRVSPAQSAPPPATPPPWQNKGRASAGAAFETGNWAQSRGDLDALMETFVFEPDAQARLNALFAAQPEADRARYGTPERMAAMVAIGATAAQSGWSLPMQIVEQARDANNADVIFKLHLPDGSDREIPFHARRFSDGWKMVLPMGQVDMLENALSSFPPTQRTMAAKRPADAP